MSLVGRIAPGLFVARFAEIVGVSEKEVCDWMNDYIGNPENWQQLGERYEADEEARAEAIKKYVADTVNGELN